MPLRRHVHLSTPCLIRIFLDSNPSWDTGNIILFLFACCYWHFQLLTCSILIGWLYSLCIFYLSFRGNSMYCKFKHFYGWDWIGREKLTLLFSLRSDFMVWFSGNMQYTVRTRTIHTFVEWTMNKKNCQTFHYNSWLINTLYLWFWKFLNIKSCKLARTNILNNLLDPHVQLVYLSSTVRILNKIFIPFRSLTDKLRLTHEQVRIIKHNVRNGEIIKIMAFAGRTCNQASDFFRNFCRNFCCAIYCPINSKNIIVRRVLPWPPLF